MNSSRIAGSRITRVPRDHILHLALGNLPRKNLARMLAAYDQLPANRRLPFLIKLSETPVGLTLPAGTRIVAGHRPTSALAGLYQSARCLLFPSIYEGFGLPILEAMSCGCPVITSRAGACAEVAGAAALLVDPLDTRAIADALARLQEDDTLALDLSRRGLQRAGDFSWDACARAHVTIFRDVARGRS